VALTDELRLQVIEELISDQYKRLAWLEAKRDELRAKVKQLRAAA
jgi:cell division protein FtsB